MLKQGCCFLCILWMMCIFSGCTQGLWSGASLVYGRHDVYKKIKDYRIALDTTNALNDARLKKPGCSIDVTVFKGDVLVAGHVPTKGALALVESRLASLKGYRALYNQLRVDNNAILNGVLDMWITTKIRSKIFADDSIDPNAFKIVTADRTVYLMGDVKPDEADKVIRMARNTNGVAHVVSTLKYFTYTQHKITA
jgi:osmotically-inducible protein OsmY